MIITNQKQFNNTYLLHQPPAIRTLMRMTNGPDKDVAGLALAETGAYLIDKEIMVYGWDAFDTTVNRENLNYLWVLSNLMEFPLDANGVPQTDALTKLPILPGGIKVTLDSGDYIPYPQPGPVHDPANPWVGQYIGSTELGVLYNATAVASSLQRTDNPIPNGVEILEGEDIYTSIVSPNNVNDLTWLMKPAN